MSSKIAIVIPTIRPESWKEFVARWTDLIDKHSAFLLTVWDGEYPALSQGTGSGRISIKKIMGEEYDLIYNKNDGVRNLGFAFIAKYLPRVEYIITLDDDVAPIGDTIQDHLNALNRRVPVSWISTVRGVDWGKEEYTRGFPYGVREEAEVVLSHGVWEGIKDYDAPTQLARGNPDTIPYRGPIPKGVYYPMCGMNLAFKRKMLPYMYYAPMGPQVGLDRFADIWLGVTSKQVIDEKGWAVVSGYAIVDHAKASNVFTNLVKEAKGIGLNEGFWKGEESDPYFAEYQKQRERWEKYITEVMQNA